MTVKVGPKLARTGNILARNQPVVLSSSPSPTRAKTTGPKPDPHHEKSGPTQPYFNLT